MAANSKEDKWLDTPTGPFARGEGKFKLGAGNFELKLHSPITLKPQFF